MSAPPPKRVFWHKPEVQEAIARLSTQEDLTVLTGAGSSAEVGFPLWGELIRRLVSAAVEDDTRLSEPAAKQAFLQRLLSEGAITAASYAEALLGDKLDHVLGTALYRGVAAPRLPGATALSVAHLYLTLGDGAELITLNYDDQLTVAFDQLGERTVKAIRTERRRKPGEIIVRHLHGQLPLKGAAEDIVLSEADYYGTRRRGWQEKFMGGRLAHGSTLFIGTSLSDPNLLRYLHSQSSATPKKHVAVFTIPMSDPVSGSTAYEEAALKKWREVGVDPIQNDMYGQTAQFVHEVRLARTLGSAYRSYDERLREWEHEMARWLHEFSDLDSFGQNQLLIQETLATAVETVKTLVADKGVRLALNEKLGIQLWSRSVSSRELMRLGASDMRWSLPDFISRAPINSTAPNPAVQAFSSGSRMLFSLDGSQSPWRSLLALPIALEDHPRYGRLPVGVLTLTSTTVLADSVLSKLRIEVPDADEFLGGDGGPGQELLDPEGALSGP
jgi:hypothetical protein